MSFLKDLWVSLTFDEVGRFSTKRTAYTISVLVTSYLMIHLADKMTWDLMVAYAAHCSGPGAIREFLKTKTKE
jgi:hypothetical protein